MYFHTSVFGTSKWGPAWEERMEGAFKLVYIMHCRACAVTIHPCCNIRGDFLRTNTENKINNSLLIYMCIHNAPSIKHCMEIYDVNLIIWCQPYVSAKRYKITCNNQANLKLQHKEVVVTEHQIQFTKCWLCGWYMYMEGNSPYSLCIWHLCLIALSNWVR